jgi:hypothetical protein
MPTPRTLFPLLAAALFASCAETDSPTAPPDRQAGGDAVSVSADVIRNPVGFILFPDFEQGLTLTAGLETSAADACANPDELVLSAGVEQVVVTPVESVNLLARSHEAQLVLYGTASTDPCDLAPAPIIATGTGHFTSTLQNLTGNGPGAAPFTERVLGTLDLTAGGTVKLLAIDQAAIRPDGSLVHFHAKLQLAPTGGS